MPASPMSSAAPAPKPAGPKPVAALPQARRGFRIVILLLVVFAAAGYWLLQGSRQTSQMASTVAVRTVKAVRGALLQELRVQGSIKARRFVNVVAPMLQARERAGLDLLYLATSGTTVKKDEVVAQLDSKAMRDHLDDVEAQVNQTQMDLLKLAAQQAAERESMEQRARAAKAALEQAQLNARAIPVKTAIDKELLRLAVQQAQETYEQAQRQVELYRERQTAQRAIATLNQHGQILHRDRHRNDIARCTIKSPMNGYAVLTTIYRNHGADQYQVRAGDQLAPGQPFMRVVDLSNMLVDGAISQADIERVHIGQRATVRLDAYPGLVMRGKVESVGSLAVGGRRTSYYMREIPVRVTLEGSDPRIIPDLSASADVVIGEQEGALLLPREAVREENGKPVVYVKQEAGFAPREVELGGLSTTQVSVTSGLQEGEEVAMQTPPEG